MDCASCGIRSESKQRLRKRVVAQVLFNAERPKIGRRLSLAALLALVAQRFSLAESKKQSELSELCIGPPNADELRDLFENESAWADTRRFVKSLVYADHDFKKLEDGELRFIFSRMREWGLSLELEVGAVKEWGVTARDTFKWEVEHWDRVVRLGGVISAISMDEPLVAATLLLHRSYEYGLEQTLDFISLARSRLPGVVLGEVEPYPHFTQKVHQRWIDDLQRGLKALGQTGLDFYRIDPDWSAYVGNAGFWPGVRTVEDYCRSQNLPFSLIYWAADYPRTARDHLATDQTWYSGVMYEGRAYAEAGGRPDQYVISSWVSAPSTAVPDGGDFTFTRSVRDFARQFVKP